MGKECLECRIIFPDFLVQPLFTSEGHTYCCPICALEIRNKLHGLNDKEFTGTKANRLLKKAKEFKNKLNTTHAHAPCEKEK